MPAGRLGRGWSQPIWRGWAGRPAIAFWNPPRVSSMPPAAVSMPAQSGWAGLGPSCHPACRSSPFPPGRFTPGNVGIAAVDPRQPDPLPLYGRAGLNEFTDEVVQSSEIQAIIRRARFDVHPEAEKAGYDKMTSIGPPPEGWANDFGQGRFRHGQPVRSDDVRRSSRQIAGLRALRALARRQSRCLGDGVRKLEEVPDVRTITALVGERIKKRIER